MTQKALECFGYVESVIPSRTSPGTNHVVTRIDGKYDCTCKGSVYRVCYHVYAEMLKDIKERLKYYAKRDNIMSNAEFDSLDQALERLSKNEEINYLCNLILILARTEGKVCSDDIMITIDEKMAGSPNRVGIAFGLLAKKGRIVSIGRRRSDRPVNHSAKQDIWVLSKDEQDRMPEDDPA